MKKRKMLKKVSVKVLKKVTARDNRKTTHEGYVFPDLTEFRKSIHVKGEPLSQVIIKGRG